MSTRKKENKESHTKAIQKKTEKNHTKPTQINKKLDIGEAQNIKESKSKPPLS